MYKTIVSSLLLTLLISCSKDAVVNPTSDKPNPTLHKSGIITDQIDDKDYIIYGNTIVDTYVAYEPKTITGDIVELSGTDFSFPIIFEDKDGGLWNVFGTCVSGPYKGAKLKAARYQLGFFFSFASFFPEVSLFGEGMSQEIDQSSPNPEWLIDPEEISQGALKDAIPALSDPKFKAIGLTETTESLYDNNELFVVAENNNGYKLYPHAILDWHEVVNDQVNTEPVALSYCPLTGTSMMWSNNIDNNSILNFGVSGLLYNSNLILYDRNTNSYWSQIREQAIHGSFIGVQPERVSTVEVNWQGAKMLADEFDILSENTGFGRDYNFYPYGNYKNNELVFFPLTYNDIRLHPKERVMAIIHGNKAKIFRFKDLPEN